MCGVYLCRNAWGRKTTLIKEFLRQCGVTEVVQSPTFTYLNVYQGDKGAEFYHFDLYRLSANQDFIDAGFYEYLYAPKSWAVIEWPEIIMPLLKHRVCHVTMTIAVLKVEH